MIQVIKRLEAEVEKLKEDLKVSRRSAAHWKAVSMGKEIRKRATRRKKQNY